MTDITLAGITKSFGDTPVLSGVDLSVRAGEFLSLVGPSGCGKSTLLRIIAGLERQDSGDVSIGGRLVNGVRAADRDLAMVFQSYALYPHLSVAENMATPLLQRELGAMQRLPVLGPWMSRGKRRAAAKTVRTAAQTLRIEALLDRKPGQLSGGQRQRAALGRAMVRKPAAFLMDEPLSNLDAALRVHMRAELSELHRRLGATFVYVTHDQAEALTMSDRMAVMRGGRILQLDTPARVYDDPAHLDVATFVGSPQMNALPAIVGADGGVTALALPLPRATDAPTGAATVGLRPEHLRRATGDLRDAWPGTLVHVEHLGADAYLHVALLDGAHRVVVRADAAEARTLSPGASMAVAPDPTRAMLFDAAGHRRVMHAAEARAVA